MVDALSFNQEHGEVCPAGWQEGDDTMQENFAGVASYLEKNADKL
jgi:peroxiredoxin (alkyl hydroperoxide reductase subunit C)